MRFRLVIGAVLGTAVLAACAPSAQAGRLAATRHAADAACARGAQPEGCHLLQTLVTWARAGAPDRSKPLLILDGSARDVATALQRAWAPESPPSSQVLDPAAPSTLQTPVDTTAYSAIVLASADAANFTAFASRVVNVRRFLDDGGGVVLLGGGANPDAYYGALPLPDPVAAFSGPSRVTTDGLLIGLSQDDAACCAPSGSFAEPPGGSALQVAERDADGRAVTVFGTGIVRGQSLVPEPVSLPADGSKACASRRAFMIHVRKLPGVKYRKVEVRVDGVTRRTFRGRHVRSYVDLRGMPVGDYVVDIFVWATNGEVFHGTRTYKTCYAGTLPGRRHRL